MSRKYIEEILANFNVKTNNFSLYELAFTHPSYSSEQSSLSNYERLEFIGDAVLQLIVSELIFNSHPLMQEGEMSLLRSKLVREETLADLALVHSFDRCLFLGNGEEKSGGRKKRSVLANCFEAFFGALFSDLGILITKELLVNIFTPSVLEYNIDDLIDHKSKLQELIQADGREGVGYELISMTGKANSPTFKVKVTHCGATLGVGSGSSKKKAEQEAAKDALSKLAIIKGDMNGTI